MDAETMPVIRLNALKILAAGDSRRRIRWQGDSDVVVTWILMRERKVNYLRGWRGHNSFVKNVLDK